MQSVETVAQVIQTAQQSFTMEEIKSVYLLNFGRFVEWPPLALKVPPAPFRICIVGADPVREQLDALLRGQEVKQHKIEVQRFSTRAKLSDCQIAYINASGPEQTSEILLRLKSSPILTVGDAPYFLGSGGMIQFKLKADTLRFIINLRAADRAQLKVSSRLLQIAESVL